MTSLQSPGCRLVLVLSLLVLVPRAALAAGDMPTSSSMAGGPRVLLPVMREGAPLRLMQDDAPFSEEFEQQRGVHPVLRVMAETGAGVVTAAGLGLAGGLVGVGLCGARGVGFEGDIGCLFNILLGTATGLSIGYPVGVWWGGEVVGANGRLLAAYAGGGVGALVGILLPVLAQRSDLILVSLPVFGMIGSTVGYELSLRPAYAAPPSGALSARPRLQPTLAVTTGGAMLGLGGSF